MKNSAFWPVQTYFPVNCPVPNYSGAELTKCPIAHRLTVLTEVAHTEIPCTWHGASLDRIRAFWPRFSIFRDQFEIHFYFPLVLFHRVRHVQQPRAMTNAKLTCMSRFNVSVWLGDQTRKIMRSYVASYVHLVSFLFPSTQNYTEEDHNRRKSFQLERDRRCENSSRPPIFTFEFRDFHFLTVTVSLSCFYSQQHILTYCLIALTSSANNGNKLRLFSDLVWHPIPNLLRWICAQLIPL